MMIVHARILRIRNLPFLMFVACSGCRVVISIILKCCRNAIDSHAISIDVLITTAQIPIHL